ncbi:MAG TPA: hypothetical protein DCY13_17480, partial [Verrucomicrobiales bacterium]|nr:hypothetical protein [Verrucomicrobiales bacterium]
MKRLMFILSLLLVTAAALPAAESAAPPFVPPEKLELREGDRVLFLGDTLIEREARDGYLETLLTVEHPDRRYTFRNLGWSGDLPNGKSRASFDWNKSPDVWFRKLTNQIALVDPTVVFVGYGMAASFAGEQGVAGFKADLGKLLDAIQTNATHKVRFVLLSPLAHMNIEGPFPTGEEHNKDLQLYADAVKEVAEERHLRFINLFLPKEEMIPAGSELQPSENGIHLTPAGYSLLAEAIRSGLGWDPNHWRAGITEEVEVRKGSYGAEITELARDGEVTRFKARPDRLPAPLVHDSTNRPPDVQERLRIQFLRLPEGDYDLLVDGQVVASHPAQEWGYSRVISRGSQFEQAEQLRAAVIRKNELFLHRWRPQNETYLFGFRKHEQGQNAAEVPQFDPLVSAADEEIHRLKQPKQLAFELRKKVEGAAPLPEAGYPDRRLVSAPANSRVNHQVDPKPKVPFEMAEGFEISLYAEDPLLAKPIQMSWDTRGRLFIASSETYPQIRPGEPADDKIITLVDENADGVADWSQVFADGLLIPTGVEPGDGGVYVAHSTELLHLRDTNGDGYADAREVVLTAFGTEDTHHLLHSLQWGLDGQLYMNQSIYIHSHIETPLGVRRLNSGGVWAYRPKSDELEIFLKGFCNPWGHVVDDYGQSFVTDGAGFQGISWGVPGAMYFTYAGATRLLDSISPGNYPKFAGLEIVRTPNFPTDWQGDMITCDFRAHRVVRFKLEPDGAGYVTREMPDLIRTGVGGRRPVDVKLGPDGALYIADWSNPIIQHGEVDFRDKRRDKESGRIWRVTYRGGPVAAANTDHQTAATSTLLDLLNSPNGQIQKSAYRMLTERGESILGELKEWTSRRGSEQEQLRALWLYQALDRINPPLLKQLLEAKDARVRAGATRVLSHWAPWIEGGQDLLASRSRDEHPRVRVEALRGLARTPSAETAALVLAVTDRPMDRFVEYAAWLSINDVAQPWIEAIENGTWKPEGREAQLAFGLKSIPSPMAARVLSQLVPEKLPADGSGGWIELIGAAGTTTELNRLLAQALGSGFTPAALGRALAALDQASRTRSLNPAEDRDRISRLFGHEASEVRSAAIRLAGAWKTGVGELLKVASAEATSAADRRAAFQSLREAGGGGVVDSLASLGRAGQPPAVRAGAVTALAGIDLGRAAPLAMQLLNDIPEDQALELWRSLLANRGAGKLLSDAATNVMLTPRAAAAGLRAVRESGREEPALLQALTLASNVAEPESEWTDAELMRFAQEARTKGDPHRGELVYRRPHLACVSCHAIGGVGGRVGPDMTSIGASAPADYLLESLVFPNRKIKEGYHSVIVTTKDEQELSGVLVRQSDSELFIRNAANQEIAVAKSNIASQQPGVSLMPAGLIDGLSNQERLDLVRFLSELGKSGPFDASKGSVARQWRLRQGTHRDEQFGSSPEIASLLADRGWNPVGTLVDGRLRREEMSEALFTTNPNIRSSMVGLWAHARFRTAREGEVKFTMNGVDQARVWIA